VIERLGCVGGAKGGRTEEAERTKQEEGKEARVERLLETEPRKSKKAEMRGYVCGSQTLFVVDRPIPRTEHAKCEHDRLGGFGI
jgi:hypothetical protein